MKYELTTASLVLTAGSLLLAHATQAALAFDQNVTSAVIFGSGNANGGWTTDRSDGVELGLRAKVRYPAPSNVFNSNGDGSYNHLAGSYLGGGNPPYALWNYEWSINSDYLGTSGVKLDDLTYLLRIDTDPTAGVSFTTSFDPINTLNPPSYWDHAIGDNATANEAGTKGTAANYVNLIATKNLAQNSWQPKWFASPFDPNITGIYDFELIAYSSDIEIAKTMMTVNVVPEPSTYVAGALLLVPFGISTIRRLRKSNKA